MPHQCTNCGRTFADGSKEMLSGCPDCGGNKFQFDPGGSDSGSDAGGRARTDAPDSGQSGATTPGNAESAAPSGTTDATAAEETGASDRVSRARETVRDWVGADRSSESESAPAASGGTADRRDSEASGERGSTSPRSTQSHGGTAGTSPDDPSFADPHEDTAQADARTDVVSRDELPDQQPDRTQEPPVAGENAQVADSPDDDHPDLSELREELNDQFESIKIVNPGQYELNLMELYDRDEYIISLQEDGRYVIEVPETWRSD
jgi:predicted  nucleic acid-binding Zn-ribbon protein